MATTPSSSTGWGADVLPDKRGAVPAITHVDGSARLQSVDPEVSPLYHRLIETFGRATGVPVVLNTSFNLHGEPLVYSPQDALRVFDVSGLQHLVLGNLYLKKA